MGCNLLSLLHCSLSSGLGGIRAGRPSPSFQIVSPSHCFSFSWARALLPFFLAPAPTPRDLPPPLLHPPPPTLRASQGGGSSSASAPIRAPTTGSASASPAPRHGQPIETRVRTVGPSNRRLRLRGSRAPPLLLSAAAPRAVAPGASAISEQRRAASGSAGSVRRCGRGRR